MKTSFYTKVYACEKKSDHCILFSLKQVSKIRIPKEMLNDIHEDKLSSDERDVLKQLGLLVDSISSEKESIKHIINHLNQTNPELKIRIVLNLDCNFDCTYCFEGDLKDKHYLSDQTEENIITFIKEKLTTEKKEISLQFYGGEPLLSLDKIRSISKKVKQITEEKDVKFSFTMISNGSLLTYKIAKELKGLGLESVQITLDGTPENHNQTRPFKTGNPSFGVIVKNIKEICDITDITLSSNYDENNYKGIIAMLDYLKEVEDLGPDKFHLVACAPIMKPMEQNLGRKSYSGGCVSYNEKWIAETGIELNREILKRGYNTQKITPKICAIEQDDMHIINYNGDLYKCPGFLGNEQFKIGNINTGTEDYTDSHKLGIWKNDTCYECEYLPLCFGGCRYMAYIREGNLDQIDCMKEFLEAILEPMVKNEIYYSGN